MLNLLLELRRILVETFGRVPQSQKAIIGRPIKRAQGGCLLPHFRRKSFSGWYNYFQVDSGGSSGLQAHHYIGVNNPLCVSSGEFWKAVSCLKFLIQGQAQSWSILVSKFNRLQDLISHISLQSLKYSMGTGKGNLLWGLSVTASVFRSFQKRQLPSVGKNYYKTIGGASMISLWIIYLNLYMWKIKTRSD